ncbi:MAG: ABC transporter substrate-binding protein [Candidatus Methylomirabilales bacterium]
MGVKSRSIRRREFLTGCAGLAAVAGFPHVARGAAAEPVKIGVLGPLTDFTGRDIQRAAQIAAEEINAAGGILGRPIQLASGDSEGVPEKAIQAWQQLTARDQVHAVVGGFRSGAILALVPHVARTRTPFIITGAASPDIMAPVKDKYAQFKYLFRAWVNSERQALSLAFVCRDILKGQVGFTRFAIDAENLKWARDYADVLKVKLKEYNLELVYETYHDPATTDFTPVFKAAQAARAQVLCEVISNQAGYVIVKQWRDQRVPLALVGNNNPSYLISSFWKDTEGKCKYELSAYTKAPLSGKSIPFWNKFEQRFGETPFYTGTGAYDSIYLLKIAAEAAKSLDRDALVAALEKVNYEGVIGRIRFDESHEAVTGPDAVPVSYGQWTGEKQKVAIWPEKFSQGKYQPPDWMK